MREAAEALRLTAADLMQLGVVDRSITEPVGGAHRHRALAIEAVGKAIGEMLSEVKGMSRDEIIGARRKKFMGMGSKGLAA